MPQFINKDGSWKTIIDGYINLNGSWKKILNGFINVAGSWKSFWSAGLVPVISEKVEITKTTNANGTIRLTGKNFHWTNFNSGTYLFQKYNLDYTTWVIPEMDSGNITNPSTGSSNTKTYDVPQSNMYPNKQNQFRFSVTATSSNNNATTSDSDPITFEMPRDITNLTYTQSEYNAVTTSYSISFTWTPSQYSGSQVIQYKQSSSSTWLDWVTVDGSTGSGGVGALNEATQYDFRILPWTGTSANGYYGNFSNQISGTTLTSNKPGKPINLSVSNITTNSLTFSWQANPTGGVPTGYIWAITTSNTAPTGGNYPSGGYSSTSTEVTGLLQNTFYYLWVAADNYFGFSGFESTTAQTLTATITPGTPQNLSHTKDYSNQTISTSLEAISTSYKIQRWTWGGDVNYYLTWSAAADASFYEISYNTTNSLTGIASYTSNTTSLTDTNGLLRENPLTRYYWVRAVSSDGTRGSWSSSTGSTAALTNSTNATIRLYRCDGSAFSSNTVPLLDQGYEWTGVNTSFTHYAYIAATVGGVAVNYSSTVCVPEGGTVTPAVTPVVTPAVSPVSPPTITSLTASAPETSSTQLVTVSVSWSSTSQASYFLNVLQPFVANYLDYGTTETSSSVSDSGSSFQVYSGASVSISLTVYNGANQTGGSASSSISYTPPISASVTPAVTPAVTPVVTPVVTPAVTPSVCIDYRYQCKSYDVVNPASNNYYTCFSVGQCNAYNNSDGSRATCCAQYS